MGIVHQAKKGRRRSVRPVGSARTGPPVLPLELLQAILLQLDLCSLCKALRVCRTWQALASPTFWRLYAQKHYPAAFHPSVLTPQRTFKVVLQHHWKNITQFVYNYYGLPDGVSLGSNVIMSVDGERVLIGGMESLLHDGMDRGCLLVRRTSDWRGEVKHGGYHIERLAHCGSYVFHLPPNASSVKLTSLTNPLWISRIPSPPGVRPTSLLVHQSALYIGATDGSVKAYTFAENHAFSSAHVFRNHAGSISCLAADESGSLLVSASDDATICVRDLALEAAGGTVTAVIRNVVAGNLDVRGKLIAYADKRKMRVVVWDAASRQVVLNLPWKVLECGESASPATASEQRNMSSLVVRLSNQYLLVANNATLHFFPLIGGRQTQPLRFPTNIVSVSLINEKLVVLTSPGTCHTYTFTARGDLQTEADRMLAEAEANSIVDSELGTPMVGEEEGDWDSEGSELGYGDYGAGFVPRGKKYWRC